MAAAHGTVVGTGEAGVHVKDVEQVQEAELWSFQHSHIVEEDHAQTLEDKPPIVLQGGKNDLEFRESISSLEDFD